MSTAADKAGSGSESRESGLSESRPSSESSVAGLSHGGSCVCELCMPNMDAYLRAVGAE